MIEYDEAWKDGQIPVRIAKRINYGLGYPFFNFNYPFVYFLGEIFHLGGFSFVASFKLLFILSIFIGSVSMYVFMLSHVSMIASFISALFYIFVPYRFLNMYVRGNPAESLALALLPLLLFCTDRLFRTKGEKFGLLIVIGSLFMLSHNGTALIGVPVILLYFSIQLCFSSYRKHILKKFVLACILIACVTSFFWIPLISETGLTKLAELSEDYPFFFPTIREVLYSPWGFGAYKQGIMPGKMSPQIGLLHIGFFTVSVIYISTLLIRKKIVLKKDWFILFFIGITFSALFFMLPVSKFIWDNFSLFRMIQTPWRFLGIIVLGCSVSAGYIVSFIEVPRLCKIVGCIIGVSLLLYANRNHIRVNMYTDFTNPFDRHPTYGFSTTSKDEHMPRLAPRIHEDPKSDGDLFPSESGTSKRTVWKSNFQEFIIDTNTPLEFRANVSYFPGWRASLDGTSVPILYSKDEYQRLRITVPPGIHKAVFRFGEPWYRLFSDIVSVIAVVYILGIMIQKKGKNL